MEAVRARQGGEDGQTGFPSTRWKGAVRRLEPQLCVVRASCSMQYHVWIVVHVLVSICAGYSFRAPVLGVCCWDRQLKWLRQEKRMGVFLSYLSKQGPIWHLSLTERCVPQSSCPFPGAAKSMHRCWGCAVVLVPLQPVRRLAFSTRSRYICASSDHYLKVRISRV